MEEENFEKKLEELEEKIKELERKLVSHRHDGHGYTVN